MRRFPFFPRHALCLLALLALAASLPARADLAQDVARLLKQGDKAQALRRVDKFLADKPDDAQGRFLKGVVLMESGKASDAVPLFSKLTEDYPELPEPYNNLAVIYAQQKQYDKARQALEMAIRTNPAYATAFENLGDIYARMASEAYGKALQADAGNKTAQTKLATIKDLAGFKSGAAPAAVPAKPAAEAAPAITPQPQPSPPAAAVVSESENEAVAAITRAVSDWALAWSNKDLPAYLASYAVDFQTPGGEPRAAWEAERTRRIAKPEAIQVSYDRLRVTVDGADAATARFRQHYASGPLKVDSSKTLLLARRDGRWLIRQERAGQ